jgi:undecaprenyl-diphosphatase
LVSLYATFVLATHERRIEATVFVATVVLSQIASELIKRLVDRPRPTLVSHLDLVYSSSFPSGHAMMSPVVYLTLATVWAAGEKGLSDKIVLQGGAVLLVVAIGVSRVYLGVHWPTDVIAGWILGSAIALVAAFSLNRLAR